MGGRLGEFGADKWALYQVAQYCDQLVPDGFGGQEPRFTCNVWLTEQRSAYQVINDICSIFRAMPVWNGQQLTVVMDRPADPVWTYTNANVDESGFSYTFSARKSRHNAIQVEYSDKENSYEKAIEYVSDDESIRKNGLNVKKITAFGCTSRGQAHRTALWLLQTEKLETKTVTFTVGAEGLMHIPGDIIKIADMHYAGTNIGGRVLAVNGKTVTLDREITLSGNSYLSYINANAKHQNIKIISVNGAEVTLDQPPVGLELYGVWSLATQQVTSQLFKALSVKEESKGKYTIMALQHEPQKEAIVDNGAKFEPVGTTVLTTPQISNIGVAVNADGSVSVNSSVTGGNGIVKYDIHIYKGGVLYDVRLGQSSPNLNIDNLENGDYSVLIQVKNENGQLLSEKTQTFTINKPPAPTGVRTTGGLGNITLEWDWVDDATATEIFTSETDNIKTAKRLTKVTARMYTHEVGAKQVRYYWLRHARGVNVGPFNQQSGIKGESAVDIDAELEVLNKKLSQNIVNEVIDTALPARNLEMTKTVTGLNVNKFIGYRQVYNTADGKLYTWNGSKYIENGVDVNGIRINTTQLVGTLQADQIGANTIGAGALQAGAVRANHLAAGEVTADKLAIGLGGNLFYNPIFANPTNGVPHGWTLSEVGLANNQKGERRCFQDPDYGLKKGGYLPNENVVRFHNRRTNNGSTRTGIYQNVPVTANNWYIVSAYMGNQNCTKVEIYIDVRGRNGEWLLHKTVGVPKNKNFVGINDAERAFIKFQVPPNGVSVDVFFFFYDADGSNANGCWMFVGRPMLEECTEYTTQPSPWANAGLTEVHGGSIIANTIRGDHILANQEIRAPRIIGGVITGNTVNGATVNGGTVNGAVVSGGTVKGAIVEGGVIKGARLEAVTGKFTGTLEVNQLVGGNLCEVFIARVYKTAGFYQAWINVSAAPVKRIFFIVNSHKTFTVEANQSHRYLYTHHGENTPPEFFDVSGGAPKICVTAYAVSNTTTMSQ